MQLGHSLTRLSRAIGQTADLCELLKGNLDSMKVLAATHAAQYVACGVLISRECLTSSVPQVHDRCRRAEP